MRAGQKRKFHKNMEYERSARQIAVLGMSFLTLIGPLALVAIAAFLIFGSHGHSHGTGMLLASVPLVAIRELNEKRQKAVADGQALIPKAGDKWTPENRTKFDAFMTEADGFKTQIDEALADVERESRAAAAAGHSLRLPESQIGAGAVDRVATVKEFRTALRIHGAKAMENLRPESRSIISNMREQYFSALKEHFSEMVSGKPMSAEAHAILSGAAAEFRDMGVGTNTAGGYFVPQGFVYDVEEAMKWYGSMLQASSILDTATGNTLPYPTSNDTSNSGELVGESVQVTTQDVTIGHITFGAFKFSTKMVKVSLELLQDSAFDMETFLKNAFAIRLGRILNAKFTTGAGTTEPLGIVTAVVANNAAAQTTPAYGTGLVAAGSAGNTGGAETGATTIGSSDLFNLEHTVDPLHRPGASYMFHDQSLRFIKTLLDKYGRPLWKPGLSTGDPDTINSYPYWINNDMATIATGNKTVLFGQMKKYLIRRVKELSVLRLNERFADFGQVAFLGFARYDGNLLDAGSHPVNYLQQA